MFLYVCKYTDILTRIHTHIHTLTNTHTLTKNANALLRAHSFTLFKHRRTQVYTTSITDVFDDCCVDRKTFFTLRQYDVDHVDVIKPL